MAGEITPTEELKDRSSMRNLKESVRALRGLLAERMLVLDGAMGTMLQQRNLLAADFGGAGAGETSSKARRRTHARGHRRWYSRLVDA